MKRVVYGFVTVIMWGYSLIVLALLVCVVINSIKGSSEIMSGSVWALPKSFTFGNYINTIIEDGFGRYFLNSIVITFTSTGINVYIAAMAAYGVGRFRFRGNDLVYIFFLLGLMFPIQLGAIPLFTVIRSLRLLNNLLGVILIFSGTLSMAFFLLAGYIRSVPFEILEAAKIDGANEWVIFNRIMLPLLRPVLAAVIPLVAVSSWNDFFIPLIFLRRNEVNTLPLGLMQYYTYGHFQFEYIANVFAATAISIIPVLILFSVLSKKIVGGLTTGAIK